MANTKATGADLKKYFDDESNWSHNGQTDAFYLDEVYCTIDGTEYDSEAGYKAFGENFKDLPDDAKVSKLDGHIGWQGKFLRPTGSPTDFGRTFNKWLKAQQVRSLVATFDINVHTTSREQLEELTSTLARLGAKITGLSVDDLAPAAPEAAEKPRGPRPR